MMKRFSLLIGVVIFSVLLSAGSIALVNSTSTAEASTSSVISVD